VTKYGEITRAELKQRDREARALIDEAVRRAKADPRPTEADLLTGGFVSYC